MKEDVATRRAAPHMVGGADALQANKAGSIGTTAAGRGGEERSDLYKVMRDGTAATNLKIGGEDGVLEGGCTRARGRVIATAAAPCVRVRK